MSQQPYLRIGYQVHRKIAYPTALSAVQKISYLNHGLLTGNTFRLRSYVFIRDRRCFGRKVS